MNVYDRNLHIIEWLDSKGTANLWEQIDELEPFPPDRCVTVGFVIHETDEYLTVVSTVGNTQVLGRLTIPKCAIQRDIVMENWARPWTANTRE